MTGDRDEDAARVALSQAVEAAVWMDRADMLREILAAVDQYHKDLRSLRLSRGDRREALVAMIRARVPGGLQQRERVQSLLATGKGRVAVSRALGVGRVSVGKVARGM